jgi:hypothetical protein
VKSRTLFCLGFASIVLNGHVVMGAPVGVVAPPVRVIIPPPVRAAIPAPRAWSPRAVLVIPPPPVQAPNRLEEIVNECLTKPLAEQATFGHSLSCGGEEQLRREEQRQPFATATVSRVEARVAR